MIMRRGVGRVGRPGLLGMAARTAVVAGTATAVAGGVSRRQQGKAQTQAEAAAYEDQQQQAAMQAEVAAQLAAQQQAQAPPPQATPAPAAPAAGGMDAKIEQLQQLAALHEQGVLTDEELAAQKAKILGS